MAGVFGERRSRKRERGHAEDRVGFHASSPGYCLSAQGVRSLRFVSSPMATLIVCSARRRVDTVKP
jgi:hypothetical protein